MNSICKIAVSVLFILGAKFSIAQSNDEARALAKQGAELYNQKKFDESAELYRRALKIDTGYIFADYQLANSLFAAKKGSDGIPYLLKVIAANTPIKPTAYSLLSLIYFTDHHYSEAEQAAIEALKIDPKQASAQRTYGLVTFHQNKRAAALMGLCSFILLEPNTARSAEAFGNIQHIIQGGTLKAESGEMVSHAIEANVYNLNQSITLAVAETAKARYASQADLLAAQLKSIFKNVGLLAEKQSDNDFFRNYMAAYFYKLSQSPNMPAFARLIGQSNPESARWIKENPKQMQALAEWMKTTERGF